LDVHTGDTVNACDLDVALDGEIEVDAPTVLDKAPRFRVFGKGLAEGIDERHKRRALRRRCLLNSCGEGVSRRGVGWLLFQYSEIVGRRPAEEFGDFGFRCDVPILGNLANDGADAEGGASNDEGGDGFGHEAPGCESDYFASNLGLSVQVQQAATIADKSLHCFANNY
jgi:hypothetical protein